MSKNIDMDNLKKLVAKNIEAGGFMNNIRAQLKVEVYKIIESQEQKSKDQVGFQWEHPLLTQIKGIAEGMKSLELIIEYLEFFKMDYTAQVLRKEANMTDPVIRDNLARRMGLDASKDSLRPLLLILIAEFGKPTSGTNSYSGIPKVEPMHNNNNINNAGKKQEETNKKKQEEERKKEELRKEEIKKNEEKKRKQEEEETKKKNEKKQTKDRPQTAPPKVEPPPVVNKIRGGPTKQNALSSMFGINLGGPTKVNEESDEEIFNGKADPYSKDIFAANKDPYDFDFEQPKKKQYDYDLNKTIGKKFNNPFAEEKGKKSAVREEIEEDMDFQESRDAKKSNLMFTSEEDYIQATQSMGVDESVDSLALEEYDYYEEVKLKK